jgi:hypothetical protein
MLFRPVFAGIWTHAQAIDGSFSFLDLLDAWELLDVRAENEARARESAEQQSRR